MATMDFIGFLNTTEPVASWSSAKKTTMLDDFCAQYGYEAEVDDGEGNMIPNPQTRKDFANDKIEAYIKETIDAWRQREAKEAAVFTEFDFS